jgi:hypothetical protein
MPRTTVSALALALLLPAGAAAQTDYFGEDDFDFPSSAATVSRSFSFPNASAAQASFLAALTGGVGTETFESFAHLTPTPIVLTFPGAGTATLAGTGTDVKDWNVSGEWRGNDRYPVSADKFLDLDANGNFLITFSAPVAAFGFYGVDVGDVGRQLILDFIGASGTTSVTVPHTVTTGQASTGNALYFGRVDAAHPFDQVRFRMTGTGSDNFAFDDMTIASVQQVAPEPSAVLLLAGGLAALGVAARRRARRSA